jgi:hypothetical protein
MKQLKEGIMWEAQIRYCDMPNKSEEEIGSNAFCLVPLPNLYDRPDYLWLVNRFY